MANKLPLGDQPNEQTISSEPKSQNFTTLLLRADQRYTHDDRATARKFYELQSIKFK